MSFQSDLARFAAKTKLRGDLIARKVMLDMSSAVIGRSPVDTGRFRNNWLLGVGTPDTTTNTGTDLSAFGNTGAIAGRLQGAPRGAILYLTNSLPYARRLEHGWSQQAPAGMVRLTVVEYQSFIAKAIAGLP